MEIIVTTANHQVGDFVAFFDKDTNKYIVGVVTKIKVKTTTIVRRFVCIQMPVIIYVIATPKGFVKLPESEIFDVAEYLNKLRNG